MRRYTRRRDSSSCEIISKPASFPPPPTVARSFLSRVCARATDPSSASASSLPVGTPVPNSFFLSLSLLRALRHPFFPNIVTLSATEVFAQICAPSSRTDCFAGSICILNRTNGGGEGIEKQTMMKRETEKWRERKSTIYCAVLHLSNRVEKLVLLLALCNHGGAAAAAFHIVNLAMPRL